jgi:hypothetical protein
LAASPHHRRCCQISTSISAGIDFAMTQLDQAPYEARRRVIDVSGDGDNNSGRDVTAARGQAIAKGVTINGLVILTETPTGWKSEHTNPLGGLANYYRNNVIGGPGAFVMVAENSNSFGDVIVKKLIAEIAQAAPSTGREIDEATYRGGSKTKDPASRGASLGHHQTETIYLPHHVNF